MFDVYWHTVFKHLFAIAMARRRRAFAGGCRQVHKRLALNLSTTSGSRLAIFLVFPILCLKAVGVS